MSDFQYQVTIPDPDKVIQEAWKELSTGKPHSAMRVLQIYINAKETHQHVQAALKEKEKWDEAH